MDKNEIEEFFATIDIDVRLPVLKTALLVENMISSFVARLLDIEDYTQTKSFDGSSSLSLNQKVNLLIDIGALDGEKRSVFLRFMEIRNRFMHDNSVKTYELCIAKLEGCQKWLLKRYKQDTNKVIEEQLKMAVMELSLEIYSTTFSIIRVVYERIKDKLEAEMNKKFVNATREAINEIKVKLDEYSSQLTQNKENDPKLNNLGDMVSKLFYGLLYKKMGFDKKGETSVPNE